MSRLLGSPSNSDLHPSHENASKPPAFSLSRNLESPEQPAPLLRSSGIWNPIMRIRRPQRTSSLSTMSLPQPSDSPPPNLSQSRPPSTDNHTYTNNISNCASQKSHQSPQYNLSFSGENLDSLSPSPLLRPRSPAPQSSTRALSTDLYPQTFVNTIASSEPTLSIFKNHSKSSSELRAYDNGDIDADVDGYSTVDSDICPYDSDDLMSVTSRRPSLLTFPLGASKETVGSDPNLPQQHGSPLSLTQTSSHFQSSSSTPFCSSDSHSIRSSSLGSFRTFFTSFGTKSSRKANGPSTPSFSSSIDRFPSSPLSNPLTKESSRSNHDVNILSSISVDHVFHPFVSDHQNISSSSPNNNINNTTIVGNSFESTVSSSGSGLDSDKYRVSIRKVVANRNALKPKAKSFLRVSRDLQNELHPADFEIRNEARITHALALREDSIDEPIYFGHRGLLLSLDDDGLSQVPGSRTISRSGSIVSCATSLTPTNTNGSTLTTTQHNDLPSPPSKSLDCKTQSESFSMEDNSNNNSLHSLNNELIQQHNRPGNFWSVLPLPKHIKQHQKQYSILHLSSSSSTTFNTNDLNKSMPATPSSNSRTKSTHMVSLCSPELSDTEDGYDSEPDTYPSPSNNTRSFSKVCKTLLKISSSTHLPLRSQAPTPPTKFKRKAALFDEATISPFDHLSVKRRAVSPGTP